MKILERQFISKVIGAVKEDIFLIKLYPVITKIESVSVGKNKYKQHKLDLDVN